MMMIMGKNANLNILMQGLSTVLGKLGPWKIGPQTVGLQTVGPWVQLSAPKKVDCEAQLFGVQFAWNSTQALH